MKYFITVLIFVSFLFSTSCKNNNKDRQNTDSTEVVVDDTVNNDTNSLNNNDLSKEYSSKYICPNHCKGSGSEKPGDCPVCGMEYIENPDYQK